MSLKNFIDIGKLGKSPFSPTHIILTSFTGTGAYSTVMKVKRRDDGKIYALKKVSELFLNWL